MRAAHAHELEQQRAGAAVSRAVLEQHLAAATAVAIAAKAVADIATEERLVQQSVGTAAAKAIAEAATGEQLLQQSAATAAAGLVAGAAVVQHGQSLPRRPGPALGRAKG